MKKLKITITVLLAISIVMSNSCFTYAIPEYDIDAEVFESEKKGDCREIMPIEAQEREEEDTNWDPDQNISLTLELKSNQIKTASNESDSNGLLLSATVGNAYEDAYNIHNAIEYAISHVYDHNYANDYNKSYKADCTNYVSSVLCFGGGLKTNDEWYYDNRNPSGTWIRTNDLYTYLTNRGYRKISIDSYHADALAPLFCRPGDVVFYDWGSMANGRLTGLNVDDGKPDHAAFCVGYNEEKIPLVAAHSEPHQGDPIVLDNGRYGEYKIYIVQMSNTAGFLDTDQLTGKTVKLKSLETGYYVSANTEQGNAYVNAVANRESASTWEYFDVVAGDYGEIGFKSRSSGNFLSARIDENAEGAYIQSAAYTHDYSKPQSWESFRLYRKGEVQYIQSQANGKWVQAAINEFDNPIKAAGSSASTWERFEIQIVSDDSGESSGGQAQVINYIPENNPVYYYGTEYVEGSYYGGWSGTRSNGHPEGYGRLTFGGFDDGKFLSINYGGTVCKAIYHEGYFSNGRSYGEGIRVYENGLKDDGFFYGAWSAGKVVFEGKRWLQDSRYNGYWPWTITATSTTAGSDTHGDWVSVKLDSERTVKSSKDGSFVIIIPANMEVPVFDSATSKAPYSYLSPTQSSYQKICSAKYVLSDGTIRYYTLYSDGKRGYYFDYVNGMSTTSDNASEMDLSIERKGNSLYLTWTQKGDDSLEVYRMDNTNNVKEMIIKTNPNDIVWDGGMYDHPEHDGLYDYYVVDSVTGEKTRTISYYFVIDESQSMTPEQRNSKVTVTERRLTGETITAPASILWEIFSDPELKSRIGKDFLFLEKETNFDCIEKIKLSDGNTVYSYYDKNEKRIVYFRYRESMTIMNEDDIEAKTEKKTYRVKYDGNQGTYTECTPIEWEANTHIYIGDYGISRNGYSLFGYLVTGLDDESTIRVRQIGDTFIIDRNIMLKALWKNNADPGTQDSLCVSIDYYSNDGTGQTSTQRIDLAESGYTGVLKGRVFTRNGYELLGWNTQPDGNGKAYSINQNVTLTKGLALYAVWVLNEKPSGNDSGSNGHSSSSGNGTGNMSVSGGGGSSGGSTAGGPTSKKTSGTNTATFSKNWFVDAEGIWRIKDKAGNIISSAWLCDDAVVANGQNVWYLMNTDGTMLSAPLVQDNTGNYYSLETQHNGFFGMLRYKNGIYDGIYMEFSQKHDGTFGALINRDAIDALKERYGVVKFGIDNGSCQYTSTF